MAAAVGGAWEYFTLSNPRIAAAVGRDPEKHSGAADPGLIDAPEYSGLVPELRVFFDTLDKSALMDRLDELAKPSRFVALRAVEPLASTPMPELGRARLSAKVFAARMRVALMDGKPDQAVRSLRHGLAMARAVEGRGTLFASSLANAIWTQMDAEVRIDILAGRLSPETSAAMLAVLDEARLSSARNGLEGERFVALETIDLFFEQMKSEAARDEAQEKDVDRGRGRIATRQEQIRQANRMYDAIGELFSVDEVVRRHGRAELAAVEALWGDVEKSPRYEPLRTLMPSVEPVIQSDRRMKMLHEGTRLMLALEVFRGKVGRYPERLRELVPGVLEQLPVDPFAADAGRVFRYRALQPESTDRSTAYVLYSVGHDGEDNGGRARVGTRINAISPGTRARGQDYILNAGEP